MEGWPPRIPIIEVAYSNGMWWSIPQQVSAELYAKFEAGQDAVYTWDWGDSRNGSWKPDDRETSINRYMIIILVCCHLGIATEHAFYACSFAA